MNASVTHLAPAVYGNAELPTLEVAGTGRLHGRTRDELFDALTFAAWYAPGVFTAVMDYMDCVDGELSMSV
jgi:hypothetical protein